MRTKALLVALLLVVIAGSCGLFAKQTQHIHELTTQKEDAQQQAKKATDNQKKLVSQIETLKKEQQDTKQQTQKTQTIQNNDETSDTRKRFSEISTDYFTKMYNFDPDTYKDRKQEVSKYLTADMIKQFFPTETNIEHANNITSKSDHIDVYNRSIQGDHVDGLVIVFYESKQGENGFKKSMDVYQVSYQPSTEKLTELQALGVGLPTSIFDKDE